MVSYNGSCFSFNVAVLLDCAANINECDGAKWTPLMLATHVGCNEAVQLLIDSNADLKRINFQGQTAYDLADQKKTTYSQVVGFDRSRRRFLVF